jgi:Uma2 family endonuclease
LRDAKIIPIVPDVACHVLPDEVRLFRLHRRLGQYFAAGVKEVWLIDPEDNTAEIWTGPSLPEKELGLDESLTSPLLPGFALWLDELFA